MKSSERTSLSNEELRRHLAHYSISELIEVIDQTAEDAERTIRALTEEINLRLMEEAE